jgi:hypothetical protein
MFPALNLLPAGHTGVFVLVDAAPRVDVDVGPVGGVDPLVVVVGGGGGGGGGVFGPLGKHVYFLVTGFIVNPYPDGHASVRQVSVVTSYVPTVQPLLGFLIHTASNPMLKPVSHVIGGYRQLSGAVKLPADEYVLPAGHTFVVRAPTQQLIELLVLPLPAGISSLL